MIDLTNSELFKDLTFLKGLDKEYDLHNKYNCSSIAFDNQERTLKIYLDPVEISSDQLGRACMVFTGVTMSKFNLFFNRTGDSATINNFYRGRFEKMGEAYEYAENGDVYFYIEFEEGDSFELFASSGLFKER